MEKIIENGKANSEIQSCLITGVGIEITFHNNDLADKFIKSLNTPSVSCVRGANKVLVYYID